MGSGVVGKTAFMLVGEVFVKVVMVFKGSVEFVSGKQECKLEGG